MDTIARYMGLLYFWFSVKDLGGFAESDFQSTLDETKKDVQGFSTSFHRFIEKWIQFLDRLAKEGNLEAKMGLVKCGSLMIDAAVQQGFFPDLESELKLAHSELLRLSGLGNDEIAKRLVKNVMQ